jgi:predicted nuclease of predicted toxin-antitoxin system
MFSALEGRGRMQVLLDTCVWGGARVEMQRADHDVVWAGDWTEDPGDEEILRAAHRERRILVTLDKDFGELAVVHRIPHAGIVRLVGFRARQQASACLQVLAVYGQELQAGAIVTMEPGRLRIRPPESGDT